VQRCGRAPKTHNSAKNPPAPLRVALETGRASALKHGTGQICAAVPGGLALSLQACALHSSLSEDPPPN